MSEDLFLERWSTATVAGWCLKLLAGVVMGEKWIFLGTVKASDIY